MMFFEMFCTVTLPVPAKKSRFIPLREMYLLSKFGKHSSSTSRNMTDNMSSTLVDDCAETLYEKMYLLSQFCDCASFRKGDVLDCESHGTT